MIIVDRDRVLERIFKFAQIESIRDCWIWTGCRDRKGYGRFTLPQPDGSRYFTRIHRVSYVLFKGPLDPEDQVDHECEVRACFNPGHLEKVSLLLNVHYRNHGRSNMTLEEYDELDAMLMEGVA